jgi:hypothetical protein
MKQFIVFLITVIILTVATNFTANAQYAVNPPQANEQGQVIQQRINLFDIPEYRSAQERARKGQTLFWVGLGTQVVGAGLACVPIAKKEVYYDYGHTYQSQTISSIGVTCGIIGGVSAIAGSVMEIVGLCKWLNGRAIIRDYQIAYSLSNGGIVIAF